LLEQNLRASKSPVPDSMSHICDLDDVHIFRVATLSMPQRMT